MSSDLAKKQGSERSHGVWEIFAEIAPGYDRMNRVLSLGLDQSWRRAASQWVPPGSRVLDAGTGTGDLALLMAERSQVVGLDFSPQMLEIASTKASQRGLDVTWIQGDLSDLPYASGEFDVVTMAFCYRNLGDPERVVAEVRRVLRPGGRLVLLDLFLPAQPLVAWAYQVYSRSVMAFLARRYSNSPQAYEYLRASIAAFGQSPRLIGELTSLGLTVVRDIPLTYGVSRIVIARNPGK